MNAEFIEALEEIEKEKGISKDIVFDALEAALISGYKKNFGSSQNVEVLIDRVTGEVRVFGKKEVAEEVCDPLLEISLEEAKEMDHAFEIGDIVQIEITPRNFGRIAAQTSKQVVTQKIKEAEREIIYGEYIDRENEILTGIVQRAGSSSTLIDLGKLEGSLSVTEQIPGESFKQGDRIKVFVVEVKKTSKGPQILLSRTHPGLVKRLFELEVPEIQDGTLEIFSISREAGSRTKIAVYSNNQEVDPVGACVGFKGNRVRAIVDELNGEKIDIIVWDKDPAVFIENSLSPSKVLKVTIKEDQKSALVVVPDYQLSLAIGKEGQNARLAAKLTGWKIDIKSETQYLEEGGSKEDLNYSKSDEMDSVL